MAGSNVTYVRWRSTESRRGPVFGAPGDDHPLVRLKVPCLLCEGSLGDGRRIQLLVLGPDPQDPDQEDVARHAEGRWYAATAVIVHESCLARVDDVGVDQLVTGLVPMWVGDCAQSEE